MQSPRPDLEAALSSLTARERQIVDYVAAGRPNKVIAIDLGISLRTVVAHRARIFAKLDAGNAMHRACRLCAHGRSGASPILAARKEGAAPPAKSGPAPCVLHESPPEYARFLAEQAPPDPDAWLAARPK